MKLMELWMKSGQKKGLKVRWLDWNYRHRFFEIKNLDSKEQCFHGTLDCGESMTYSSESPHWCLYLEGDEDGAKAS
jgi:hypothetical protein